MVYGKVAVSCKKLAVTTQNSRALLGKKKARCGHRAPVNARGWPPQGEEPFDTLCYKSVLRKDTKVNTSGVSLSPEVWPENEDTVDRAGYKLNWQRIARAREREQSEAELAAIESRRGGWTRQAYADFLQGYNWDDFITCTFRTGRRDEKYYPLAGIAYVPSETCYTWQSEVKPRQEPYYALQSVWHTLQGYNVARAFLGCEPHQSGDLHIHGLASGPGPAWRPGIALPWDIWAGLFKRFGRTKVEACNSQGAVSSYCAKYLLKQQSRVCDYYEVFGNKLAWVEGRDLTSRNDLCNDIRG